MRIVFYTLILIYLSAFPGLSPAQEKKAFKLLEKGDYLSLSQLIDKEIADDSINPGFYYLKSLMFLERPNPNFSIDSSYQNVLITIRQFSLLDEKAQSRLNKSGITPIDFGFQKTKTETLAFERAKSENSLDSYNFFIEHFGSAAQINDAIDLRNITAFEKAEKINTYEAYLDFVKSYPTARQSTEAQTRYDLLIYREFTKDDLLNSYERFAYSFPTSSHWNEAVKNIFQISTADNRQTSYFNFIKSYPLSEIAKIAAGYLYFSGDYANSFNPEITNEIHFMDSVKAVKALDTLILIPVFENNLYGFIDQSGKILIPSQFKNIDPSYLCGEINHNFLIVWKDSSKCIVARNGNIIYQQSFYTYEDIGSGLIKLSRNAKYGIIHKSGLPVLPFDFNEIGLVNKIFIKARTDHAWNLYTVTGRLLLKDEYEDILEEGNFILFKKAGKIAITTRENILALLEKKELALSFIYDETELIENDLILCKSEAAECILNDKLVYKIPLEPQQIFSFQDGWLVKRDSLYDILDKNFTRISGSGLENIRYKGNWITGVKNNKRIVYYQFATIPGEFIVDSVLILDENYLIIRNNKKEELILQNFLRIPLNNYSGIKVLPRAAGVSGNTASQYLILNKKNRESAIMNSSGKICFSGKFENLESIGPNFFLFTKNGKYGLLDSLGKILVKPEYEGIGNYQNGFMGTFKGKSFGIINPYSHIMIQPRFSSMPELYNLNYFIIKEGGNIGLIDHQGNILFDTVGSEIKFWNDTSCLVHSGNKWQIRDTNSGKAVLNDISGFKKISDSGNNVIYFVERQNYLGVLGNNSGILINLSFSDILNIGSADKPVYFAEKYINEADLYIVIYYSSDGMIIRKQVFSPEEYAKIYCR